MPSDLGLFRKTPRQLVKSIQPTATVSSPEQTSHLKQFPWNKCHCTVPSWWQYMLELLALSESLWIANSGSHNCSKGLIKCRIKWQIKANQTPCRRYRKISCFQMGEGTYQIILLLFHLEEWHQERLQRKQPSQWQEPKRSQSTATNSFVTRKREIPLCKMGQMLNVLWLSDMKCST